MHELLPISGIRESYRLGSAPRTVAMPLLIAAIAGGLVWFVVVAWDGPGGPTVPAEASLVAAVGPSDRGTEAATPTGLAPTEPSASPENGGDSVPLLAPRDVGETDYTPWLSPLALDTYLRQRNPGHGGSYWSRGDWIRAVEGRWRDGAREYRIALGTMSRVGEIRWRYRLDLTETAFAEELARHSSEGFALRQSQAYALPDASRRYQAVWVRPD